MKKIILPLIFFLLTLQIALAGTVTRSFSASTILPGSSLTVSLVVNVDEVANEQLYSIEEKVPTGFTITDPGTGSYSGNTIRWFISTAVDITHTYTVSAPATEGAYEFYGTYMFGDDPSTSVILGSTTVNVGPECTEGSTRSCGSCSSGTQTCSLGVWGTCIGAINLNTDSNNCGSCGNSCLTTHTTTCTNAVCNVCELNYWDINGDGTGSDADGCEYACTQTGNIEICDDGVDNNCDGQINEGCLPIQTTDKCPAPAGFQYDIPSRVRTEVGGVLQYCDPLTLTLLDTKSVGSLCNNDYECEANICAEGACTELVKKIEEEIGLLKKIYCWILHPLDSVARDTCLIS